MSLPVGDLRQVTMGTEWLAEPQESGVYKRGSRGDDFTFLHTLLHSFLFTPLAPSCILDSFKTLKLLIVTLTHFLLKHNWDFVYLARNLKVVHSKMPLIVLSF